MRRYPGRFALYAVVFFVVFAAGCATVLSTAVGVRPPSNQLRDAQTYQVAMRDGVKLATDVYLPDKKGPFPVVLVRTPYGKGQGNALVAKMFGRRGYAVVVQDVRGRYGSGGKWDPFINEGPDGADTAKWVKRQAWCDGKLGLFGMSYFGHTAWSGAAYGHGEADALAPTVTSTRMYDIIWRQGVFNLMTGGNWGLANFGRTAAQGLAFHPGARFQPPLIEVDNHAGRDVPFFNDWVEHPQFDAYWRRASAEGRWENIDAPALVVGGWYDLFGGAVLRDWQDLTTKAGKRARRESRLVIGPWSHAMANKLQGENFGHEADFIFLSSMYIDWFDQHLMGRKEKKEPRVKVFTTGVNRWEDFDSWPPADGSVQKWYLHSDGKANRVGNGELSRQTPGRETADTFVSDPDRPVPTLGGALYPPANAGPADVAEQGARQDVLVYTSPKFDRDFEITGPVEATIWLSADAADADVAVTLADLAPDGTARLLVDGIARASYRGGGERRLLDPGKPVKVTVDLWGISHVIEKGHSLRVHVAGTNYPRFAPNPGTDEDVATARAYRRIEETIYHDDAHQSYLTVTTR